MSKKMSIHINHHSRHIIISCISCTLFVTGLLQGQNEEPKEIESHYILPDIVVTATKTSQTLQEVPLSTTLVSREFIDMIPALDVADVLQIQTGTTIRRTSHGGMTTISLRGTQAAQVLVTRDGIPINDAFNGTTDLSQLSLNSIEKIEIVRGPTSHLYGANALGGVINLITREVRNAREITLSQGSFNTQAMTVHAGTGNSDRGVSMSANLDRSDGWRDNDDYLHHSVVSNAATFIGGVSIGFTAGYSDADVGVPGPKPAAAPTFGNEKVSSLFNRQTNENAFGLLTLEASPWATTRLQLRVRPEWNTTVYHDKYEIAFIQETQLGDYEYRGRNLRINGQMETILSAHRILSGFELIDEAGSVRQETWYESDVRRDTTTWKPRTEAWAAWTEFIGEWTPLRIVGGLRMDEHSVYGRHMSPSLGVVFRLERQVLKFSLGKAYRAPSHNDLFWPIFGNPDLKPEEGLAVELSYEHYLLPNLRLKSSLFRREVEDMIAWIPSGSAGFWQPHNINAFELDGMEFELTAKYPGYHFSMAYTYLDGKQVNQELTYSDWWMDIYELEEFNRRAASVPRHTVSHSASWITRWLTFSLNANWRSRILFYYQDWSQEPQILTEEKILPARMVLNLKLVLRMGMVQPYLAGMNLFNVKYSDQFGTGLHDRDYPMPGTTVEVGVKLKF